MVVPTLDRYILKKDVAHDLALACAKAGSRIATNCCNLAYAAILTSFVRKWCVRATALVALHSTFARWAPKGLHQNPTSQQPNHNLGLLDTLSSSLTTARAASDSNSRNAFQAWPLLGRQNVAWQV